jgi:methylmalonyl-CoA epimerase
VTGGVDHIGIATADLDGALAFYRDVLGMRVTWDEVVEEQGVRAVFLAPAEPDRVPSPTAEIELLIATRDDSAIARFIAKRGPGLHHVAWEVDDIAAALADCRARGLRLVDETPRRGARGHLVAFLHPATAGGVLVELVQRRHS